jgi:hypothetical protein
MLLCPLSRRPLVLITQKPGRVFSGKPIATEKSKFPAIEVGLELVKRYLRLAGGTQSYEAIYLAKSRASKANGNTSRVSF